MPQEIPPHIRTGRQCAQEIGEYAQTLQNGEINCITNDTLLHFLDEHVPDREGNQLDIDKEWIMSLSQTVFFLLVEFNNWISQNTDFDTSSKDDFVHDDDGLDTPELPSTIEKFLRDILTDTDALPSFQPNSPSFFEAEKRVDTIVHEHDGAEDLTSLLLTEIDLLLKHYGEEVRNMSQKRTLYCFHRDNPTGERELAY